LDESQAQLDRLDTSPGDLPGHVRGLLLEAARLVAVQRGERREEQGADIWP
jgi:hypothetical protein